MDALSWNELNNMVKKPIWMMNLDRNTGEWYGYWLLIQCFSCYRGVNRMHCIDADGYHNEYEATEIGVEWNAYEKEM